MYVLGRIKISLFILKSIMNVPFPFPVRGREVNFFFATLDYCLCVQYALCWLITLTVTDANVQINVYDSFSPNYLVIIKTVSTSSFRHSIGFNVKTFKVTRIEEAPLYVIAVYFL